MKNEELVSIIIPVYNSEKYLKDTINTIKEQTYTNYEVIFIDDCSTDKSIEIIEENKTDKIILYKLDKNYGPAIARNKGVELSKGRYIAFLDSDDMWEPKKLEKQLKFMKENNYSFTYTDFVFTKENGKSKGKAVKVQKAVNYDEVLKNTRIVTSSVIIDTEYIKKENLLMPNENGEDTLLWWSIIEGGIIAYGINETLVKCRRHKDSLSANKFKFAIYRWKMYRNVKKFSIPKTLYYYIHYVVNSINKRI